jgi:hypothetical protein
MGAGIEEGVHGGQRMDRTLVLEKRQAIARCQHINLNTPFHKVFDHGIAPRTVSKSQSVDYE